jgi:sugar O-acyltransferase (sialic acid O-acetyltransferase NeuD family)
MKQLVIVGAGGHGKVVLDGALISGWAIWGLVDDDSDKVGSTMTGYEIKAGTAIFLELIPENIAAVIAVGSNVSRAALYQKFSAHLEIVSVIHPAATISDSATIGAGAVIMPGAVVNAEVSLGAGVIVNTNSSIDHDCRLGDFAQVSPGSTICGCVNVGERTFIGAGATILQGLTVGNDAIVAAGAVVTKDVPPGVTVKGIPAV